MAGTNIGQLLMTLELQVKGIQQAVGQMENASAKTKLMADQLGQLEREANKAGEELQAAEARFKKFGKTADQVRQEVKQVTKELEHLIRTKGSDKALADALGRGENAIKARTALNDLTRAQQRFTSRSLAATRAAERMERHLSQRVPTASRRAANGLNLTNEELGRLAYMLARGNVSLGSFGAVFGRVLAGFPAFLVGLAAFGAAIAPVVLGFKVVNSELSKLSDHQQALNSFAPLTDGLSRLANRLRTSSTELQSFLATAQNRAASAGIIDTGGFARAQGEAAAILRGLGPDSDPNKALQAIGQAAQGNVGALAEYGVNLEVIQRALQSLPEDASVAERQMAAFDAVVAQLNARLPEAQRNLEAQRNSFTSLSAIAANLRDAFARHLAPSIDKLVVSFKNLISQAAPFIAWTIVASKALVEGLGAAMEWVVDKSTEVVSGLANILELYLRLRKGMVIEISDTIEMVGDALSEHFELEPIIKDIRDMVNEIDEAPTAVQHFDHAFQDLGDTMDQVRQKASDGFGLVQGATQAANALRDLNHEFNPENVRNFVGSLEGLMDKALDGDVVAKLQAQRNVLHTLFERGLIPKKVFDDARRQLDNTQTIMGPFIAEAEKMKRQAEHSAGGFQAQASALDGSTSSAAALESQLSTLSGQIVSTATTARNNPIIVQTGMVGFSMGNAGFAGVPNMPGLKSAPTGNPVKAINAGRHIPDDGSSSVAEMNRFDHFRRTDAQRVKNARQEIEKWNDAMLDQADALKETKKAGGGTPGASIDDIRAFFREMNRFIKIGLNKGVSFTTAGNTIPLGGPGEFLNSKNGVLIETFNVNAVWDFADPGAKRKMIREMEEALRNLKRER